MYSEIANGLIVRQLVLMVLLGSALFAEHVVTPAAVKVSRQAYVSTADAGIVVEVLVREGDRVKQGDVLLQLDDRDSQFALERAELNHENARVLAESDLLIRIAQQSLRQAKRDQQRIESQWSDFPDTVSEAELDQLRIASDRAALEVDHARERYAVAQRSAMMTANELKHAKYLLQKRRITAPIDGIVVEVLPRSGEWINQGDRIARIIDTAVLRAEGWLKVSVGTQELLNRPVSFVPEQNGEQQKGKRVFGQVVFVSPELNPLKEQARVWCELDNSQDLIRPGTVGQIVIEDVEDVH